jgi:phosphoglycerate kinase
MNKKTVKDIDFNGKRVLMRVDFNVPLDGTTVNDDTRIRAAIPTIKYVIEQGASKIILMSHLGRPKGEVKPEFSLQPAATHLAKLIGQDVTFAPDCVGAEVTAMAESLPSGGILLLENLRFHPEEEGKVKLADGATAEEKDAAKAAMQTKQKEFASQLASLADVYVNDAFGTAHRAHASMAAVTEYFENSVSGLLLEKEIQYLGNAVKNPEHPFVAIIGGGMVYTFYLAKGIPVGNSLIEEDRVEMAKETLKTLEAAGVKIMLPVDHVEADAFSADANTKVVNTIEDGWMALDIGPETSKLYAEEISKAKTIVWNGPMGCFEMEPFANGTMTVTKAVAETDCVSIIGGGDSVSAVNKSGLADQMTHISTGGGASLEFLEGKKLPGIEALSDR